MARGGLVSAPRCPGPPVRNWTDVCTPWWLTIWTTEKRHPDGFDIGVQVFLSEVVEPLQATELLREDAGCHHRPVVHSTNAPMTVLVVTQPIPKGTPGSTVATNGMYQPHTLQPEEEPEVARLQIPRT